MRRYAVLTAMAVIAVAAAMVCWRCPSVATAQAAPPASSDAAVTDFWKRWETVRPSEAIRQAAASPDYQRLWERLGQAADDFQGRSGRCLGHSQIARRTLGDRMEYVSFFALYDPTPMRVQMLFYRASDKWSAVSVRIDASPYRWLQEANPTTVAIPAEGQQQGETDNSQQSIPTDGGTGQ